MYAVIRRYNINPDQVDDLAHRTHAEFVSIIKQSPGFIGYHLINAGNGVVVTFSLFNNQAAADESTRLAADWIKQNLSSIVQGPPEITEGEVLVHAFK